MNDFAAPIVDNLLQMKMQNAHAKLGHCGEDFVKSTAKYYNWNITGAMKPCEACAIGKAKQAPVSKQLNEKSNIPGEKWFIDITSIAHESFGGTKYWFRMLDDCTDNFFSFGIERKSYIGHKLVQTFENAHYQP